MTALALQNHELLQTLASTTNGRQVDGEGHMTLRTKVVEEDDDPVSKIVAAKTAAILNGSKSPEITDETGVSRKPRKGTPVKLCHTPPAKSIPAEVSKGSPNDSSETDSKEENCTDLSENTNSGLKDAGNLNIGTMKIPIHKPSKESPRAMLKNASSTSPSNSTKVKPESTTEDIIEAVANSNAEETLAKVETLRLNDKQYEIVSLGNKQWITRNEYEIMKELSAVQKPSGFSREKNVAALKVPVFKVNRNFGDSTSNDNSLKRTIDEVDDSNMKQGESNSKKHKKEEENEMTTPEESDSQDESDTMVIDTDTVQGESKETQGDEKAKTCDEQLTDIKEKSQEAAEEGKEAEALKDSNQGVPAETTKEANDEK